MRVVFSCVPQTGHVTPLLPLAQAFAAQGDEVVVASGPDVAETVSSQGLAFREVCPPFDSWFAELRARTRGMPGDGLAPARVEFYFIPRLFAEIGTSLMVDGLLELCREVKPDLLVFDPGVFAAPLVAALTGAHGVLLSISPLTTQAVLDLATDAVSPTWREFGLDVPLSAGFYSGTTLVICPPALDPAAVGLVGAQPMRPVAPPQPNPKPLAVTFADSHRPLVYLTLGTFSNNALDLFRLVIDALADDPVNVLATIGRNNDPSTLGTLPDNARVERFIPQDDVLPHCTAIIHHAGAGTMFGALAHGLPSVALPQSADNFIIAERLAHAGVARVVMPADATEVTIRAALREVMEAATYRHQSQQIASQIAAMPSPAEVAARLRR